MEEIPYSVVVDATGNFSDEEWGEGGHKVGKGGFGQVYCCRLKLADKERVVAVKVLSKKVAPSSIFSNCFCYCTSLFIVRGR